MSEEVTFTQEQVAPVYDLSNKVARSAVAVIDAILQRGAFRGEEISTIGQLRDQCIQLANLAEEYHSMLDEE